jgi:hypothetical protein
MTDEVEFDLAMLAHGVPIDLIGVAGTARTRAEDEWADVWAEYRSVFDRLGLDETRARAVVLEVAGPDGDPDRVADALKEFAVRSSERGVGDDHLRAELAYAGARLTGGELLEREVLAARLFGVAAEDLGADACERLAHLATLDTPT